LRTLDTPWKRIGALLAATGFGALTVSLILWTAEGRRGHRIYYAEKVFDWVKTDLPSLPISVGTDTLWTFNHDCLEPHQKPRSAVFSPRGIAGPRPASQREGEALDAAWLTDTSGLARVLGNADATDTRTKREKIIDGLAFAAGLRHMPRGEAEAVLRGCSTTTGVVLQHIATRHHTDLPAWTLAHGWVFWPGVALVAVGLLLSLLYELTLGPVVRWVRGR
jgi:hypothetical protein